ncbi:DUF1707 domain-containing protein [Nocardioides sp.]|uniref:DUF1707 SHOCT-like domain-containing protein n=1 Tax=Nocardioides sp. TaxID=35761 RepID=UPI0031FE8BE9|nr:hypothetical protein [Nocardioides sp.]
MSPPSERVGDGDKRRARNVIEQALTSGRIIQADRDKRIEGVDNAQSVDELRMLTHDLDRSAMYGGAIESPMPGAPAPPPMVGPTVGAAGTPPAGSAPNVPYGPPTGISPEALAQIEAQVGAAAKRSGRGCLGCLLPLVIVIAVFGGIGLSTYSDVRDAIDKAFNSSSNSGNPGPNPGSASANVVPDVLSVGGWNDLKAAIRSATGRTEAFAVVLYPEYAAVTAPVDATGGHSRSFYWDGELSSSSTSSSTTDRFDMDDIRPAALVRLVAKARKLVDNPSTWYAIVQPPDYEGTSIMAYAVNEFGDTVYISATADGRIIRRYDSTKP